MTSLKDLMHDNRMKKWLMPLALLLTAAVTVAIYWPVIFNDFISYDDTDYVTMNMMVRQGLSLKGIAWAFSAFHAGNWHPFTWLSHMLDVELFGLKPMGHHATNLLLHTLNSVLLCAILHRMTGFVGRSMIVALLFAIHPLHVESVAWVAERKDVLSTLFWFLAIWFYTGYVRKPGLKGYLAVCSCFVIGMMSKQMLVTAPLVLLLIDYWPLNRLALDQDERTDQRGIKFLLLEKIPLFMVSATLSLVTVKAQDTAGALAHGAPQSVLLQAGNAFLSYMKYILKMFWPADLAPFYPFEPSSITALKTAAAVAILAALSAVAIAQRKNRPYILFGWFWYVVTLLPVIGFIRVGSQALADRYTYIPLIGLFVIIAWGGAEAAGKWRNGLPVASGLAVIVMLILGKLTITQISYWNNSHDLYRHALSAVKGNWLAHNNIGILLSQHNRNDEAIFHFRESVRLNAKGGAGFRNLGNALQMSGNNTAAIEAYREAVKINPNDGEGHFLLGYAYLFSGTIDQAHEEYRQLLRLQDPRATHLLNSIQDVGRR